MDSTLRKLGPPVFLVLLPLCVFWRLVFAGQVLYWGVPLYQFYPWHIMVVEAIQSGHLPLWTDLVGAGMPLLANHQSAVFYPLNLIYLLMPVEQAMGYSVVAHLIMAGLFAYVWGQEIGLSRFGATVIGLSFMLSGFFVGRTQFITIINGAAWLPLLFLLAERLTRRRTLPDAVWLGVALALQFLAGHAQLWFYSLWVLVIYILTRVWSLPGKWPGKEDAKRGWRGYVFILLASSLVLSLGLSAVQLLPTAELTLNSQRAGGLDPTEAMTYSFWPWRLLTLALPDLFGSPATGDYWGYATYWEDTAYIGVLPLLLALSLSLSVAGRVVSRRGRPWLEGLPRESSGLTWQAEGTELSEPKGQKMGDSYEGFLFAFFLFMILFSLILAMGQNTPVYPFIFKYVPGFGAFRAPARFLLFYTFGVSTLAGMGADRFRLTYTAQYVARLTVAGAGAMLGISLALGRVDLPIELTFISAVGRFAVGLGLSSILLLLRGREPVDADGRVAQSPLSFGVWRGLVIGFIAVDLALFAMPLTPTISPALYQSTTEVERFLLERTDQARLFATYDYDYNTKFNNYLHLSDFGSSDLTHWLSFRGTMVPNLNVLSRIPSINNDEPLVLGRWRDLMDALRIADWPERERLLQMMNVGYVLADAPPPGLSRVEDMSDLYRLSQPLPRGWVVPQARLISAPEGLLPELMAASFDPMAEVLIETIPQVTDQPGDLGDSLSGREPSSSPGPVDISLREEGNSRTIDLVMSQPGYLVLAFTHYPGWRATVDDRPTEILRANYAFMALPLSAGEHQVTLLYRPLSLILGGIISVVSVLGLIGIVVLRTISKKNGASREL